MWKEGWLPPPSFTDGKRKQLEVAPNRLVSTKIVEQKRTTCQVPYLYKLYENRTETDWRCSAQGGGAGGFQSWLYICGGFLGGYWSSLHFSDPFPIRRPSSTNIGNSPSPA